MMKGTKRFASSSDSIPDCNDSDFRSKRVMEASPFDVHRAEPCHQHLTAVPRLDIQRAESSHQHVRALNTQFASWVQSQLQNHPDELWQDGVQDYLNHASHIMEKFSDVVEWLKANAARVDDVSNPAPNIEKSSGAGANTNEVKLLVNDNSGFAPKVPTVSFTNSWSSRPSSSHTSTFPGKAGSISNSFPSAEKSLGAAANNDEMKSQANEKSVLAREVQTVSFSNSWSSGLLSSSQTPIFAGSQSSTFIKQEPSGNPDAEDEGEQPSSPSLKKTEEKGILVVHEVKCKVYVKPDNPADKGWKDIGMGQLSIKCIEGASKATKESKPTIIIRNDVGKVLLNALLYTGMKMNVQKNTITTIFHTLAGGNEAGEDGSAMARLYLLRMKTEEDTNNLAVAMREYTPA